MTGRSRGNRRALSRLEMRVLVILDGADEALDADAVAGAAEADLATSAQALERLVGLGIVVRLPVVGCAAGYQLPDRSVAGPAASRQARFVPGQLALFEPG